MDHALSVLADLREFCRRRRVRPHVCLSGGDPMQYRHFWELYEAVARSGVGVSILGNPIAPEAIERLLGIAAPAYYQVSLEGLGPHDDAVRGAGHYQAVTDFLLDARARGLAAHVMLTLTADNIEQVLPLGERLRGLCERFTFNRLSRVGGGADLELPSPERFAAFLAEYLAARRSNPVLGAKDNLFNILRLRYGRALLGGCTGHGCGAAFNFMALLPDGEIHACRKFPSPIGRLDEGGLAQAYDSLQARRYRTGATNCRGCRLARACRGCPAVTHGAGLDPLVDRDPYCFLQASKAGPPQRVGEMTKR